MGGRPPGRRVDLCAGCQVTAGARAGLDLAIWTWPELQVVSQLGTRREPLLRLSLGGLVCGPETVSTCLGETEAV